MAVHNVTGLGLTSRPCIAAHPYMADTRQPQPTMLHVLTRQETPSIAVGGITPSLKPFARFEAGIPRLLASFDPTKERLACATDPFERVLGCLGWKWCRFFTAYHGQILTLLGIAHTHPLTLPRGTPLFQRSVVQQAMGFTVFLKRHRLRWRGIQAIGGTTIDSFHTIKYNLVMETRQPLKTMYHCVYNLNFHLVLVTKYRRKCSTSAMRDHLTGTFTALLDKWGGILLECNGEGDHMHLLIELPPTVCMATFVNNLKTVSSRRLRRDYGAALSRWYRRPVLWSRSYCVLNCGGAPLSVLRQYIEQQGNGASNGGTLATPPAPRGARSSWSTASDLGRPLTRLTSRFSAIRLAAACTVRSGPCSRPDASW